MNKRLQDYIEHEGLQTDTYDFDSSHTRSRYEEERGTMDSEPDRNARIIEFFKHQQQGLEARIIDPKVIASAAETALIINPTENRTDKNTRERLSRLRGVGWSLPGPYSNLRGGRLLAYAKKVYAGIRSVAREVCPEVLANIDRKNAELVNEVYHY